MGKSSRWKLKLMVDKRKSRVVYAECGRSIADVFFSLLVTPVGALVRRTGKDSGLGCMDSLYKSVEDMDLHHFRTPACRELLLRPKSAFGFPHHRLKIAINDVESKFYTCRQCSRFSMLAGVKCKCGRDMTQLAPLNLPCPTTSKVVFVRRGLKSFVVTDDLFLAPSSDSLKHELCIIAGVEYSSTSLEEKIVRINNDNIVELMKLSLHSSTPLTDAFLSSDSLTKPIDWPIDFLHQHLIMKEKKENLLMGIMKNFGKDFSRMLTHKLGRRKISITLFHNKKRVLLARVGKDFVDLICSFLTFPLGSIVKAAAGRSSLGCLDNLHRVAEKFSSDGHFYGQKASPKRYGEFILNPPVALHHNSEQIKIGKRPHLFFYNQCPNCRDKEMNLQCGNHQHRLSEWKAMNPKYEGKQTTKKGEGYIRCPQSFVITNAFVVKPTYDLHDNQFASDIDNQFASDIEKKTVNIGHEEALKLLMASLLSQDPLTDIFLKENSVC